MLSQGVSIGYVCDIYVLLVQWLRLRNLTNSALINKYATSDTRGNWYRLDDANTPTGTCRHNVKPNV